MKANGPILKRWYPEWDPDSTEDAKVTVDQRLNLKYQLRKFVDDPFGAEIFKSDIPFRIAGYVYGHPKPDFPDDTGILTSRISEIRRIKEDAEAPRFELQTENRVYTVSLGDFARLHC